MIQLLKIAAPLLFSFGLQAQSIKDFKPYEYEVRFTNPICQVYRYENPVIAIGGESLTQKPKDAYCEFSDEDQNIGRKGTPSEKYIDWIADPETKELFLSYLSFSSDVAREAFCTAMKKRGVKIQMVLHQNTSVTDAQKLEECGGDLFTLHLRGEVPGIDFAHTKLMLVNPNSTSETFRAVFGSGNLSSGLTMHHENWHFLTTHRQTYFAQSHLCLMEAELKHFQSGNNFKSFMRSCLAAIAAPVEQDLQPFFVPGQGDAAFDKIEEALQWSTSVEMAAHRLSFPSLVKALLAKLETAKLSLKLVADDDIYWVNRPNSPYEKGVLRQLMAKGARVRFIETNDRHRYLHHNKFMIFKGNGKTAVFTGAGNFTGTAFSVNWENFYYITIPEVVESMQKQFDHLYSDLGSSIGELPQNEAHPKVIQ